MFRWFDSNQRSNDQGFINFRTVSDILHGYVSAQVKTTWIETRLQTVMQKRIHGFIENVFQKILSRNGGQALALAAGRRPDPHLFERDFLKKFFCKNMNSVSHPVGSRVSKNVVLTCAEIYSCKISEAVLNRWIPVHSISD